VAYATSVDCRTEITRQLPLEPDVVTLIEQWESLEDLYAHGSASHMAEFREQNGKLILSSELRISEG
jgi:quinol monooxygenase YgiN